ncbi:squalene--hopene cyclase [Pseudalkalibacillus sp. SCS-8]|uniref:squalene--hopene cyclase n=1 Tax=Pseudalkalibacillus nanhaiensis TaxID=3115291 RepID=UPI0032DB951C
MVGAIEQEINRIVNILLRDQKEDGSWDYAFDTGIITDTYTIILLRTLGINDEYLILSLMERILKKQEKDGSWKLFRDQAEGDLSTTIQAYNALLFSEYIGKDDPPLKKAKQFIIKNGGIGESGTFTKILLAVTGQFDWNDLVPVPIEILLLPKTSPLQFYDISVFGRANIAPILILREKKYQLKTKHTPDLSDLYINQNRSVSEEVRGLLASVKDELKKIAESPARLKEKALKAAESYMLKRIEPDGTLLSYFSSTLFMIYALMALGYNKNHPLIRNAINGIWSMAQEVDGTMHMQYTTANVWNTSLISHALQQAGVDAQHPSIIRANQYLLSKQHHLFGDWVLNNPDTMPGGWGFSNINTINPDVDDSTASLRALRTQISHQPVYQPVWTRGTKWVLSMQNKDGGWPAFEKGVDKHWLALAPIQGAEYLLLDPSTADLTGRTLEFLGNYTHLNKNHPSMKQGVKWLIEHQLEDGSWYGRWGICYIYGTWAALTGMAACSVSADNRSIRKAINWLKSIQNEDGGWGESCNSDIERKYVPLGESTLTHTAWAVDALIAVSELPTPEIEKGISYLTLNGGKMDWTEQYPKGQGMAAGFYIHYHSYRYIWPLLALSHYKSKYE